MEDDYPNFIDFEALKNCLRIVQREIDFLLDEKKIDPSDEYTINRIKQLRGEFKGKGAWLTFEPCKM